MMMRHWTMTKTGTNNHDDRKRRTHLAALPADAEVTAIHQHTLAARSAASTIMVLSHGYCAGVDNGYWKPE